MRWVSNKMKRYIVILIIALLAGNSQALMSCGESTNYCDSIAEFSDGSMEKVLEFPKGGGSNSDAKVTLPKGYKVCNVQFDMSREPPTTVKYDFVFIIDTSGSMDNEWGTLCDDVIDPLVADIQGAGVDLEVTIYGLGSKKSCATESIPGHSESWGPGTEDRAINHPWRPDANRIIFPISDEGPDGGDPVSDPGSDRDSIEDAITACKVNEVTVYGLWGDGSSTAVINLMKELSTRTGGEAYYFGSADEVAEIIKGVIIPPESNVALDAGRNGVVEWNQALADKATISDENTDPKLSEELSSLLEDCSCAGCSLDGDDCTIDLEITSDQHADITLNRLALGYCEKTCGDPCGEITCTIYRYSEDFPKLISACIWEFPDIVPVRFLDPDDHYMQEETCERLLVLIGLVEGWNLAADLNQKEFKIVFELWYEENKRLKSLGLPEIPWNPSVIPYPELFYDFKPFSENRLVVGEAWDPSFDQSPVSHHREGRALDMHIEDITGEEMSHELRIEILRLLAEREDPKLVFGDLDFMNESVLADLAIRADFDFVFHSCEHIHVCVSIDSGAKNAEYCDEPRYNLIFKTLGLEELNEDTPTPPEDTVNSILFMLGEDKELMGTRGGIRNTWETLYGEDAPLLPPIGTSGIATSAAESRKKIATAALAPEPVEEPEAGIKTGSLQQFWTIAGAIQAIPWVGKSSLGKALASELAAVGFRGIFKDFVKKIIFDRIREMCEGDKKDPKDGMPEFILLNPDLRHNNVINSVELFIHLLQPFYLLGIAVTAFYLIFVSGSIIGRARAKSTLISLVISFAIIIFTIPILGFLLDLSQFISSLALDLVDTQIGSDAVCGEGLRELEHLYSSYMVYTYENPTVIMMFTALVYLGAFLVLSMRFFMIILWAMFFPFAVFFYAFHFTRNLGRFMLFQTSWWILIQVIGAMTWISITVAWILLSGTTVFPVTEAVLKIAFAVTAMILMAATPLFALGVMDWISFLLFSLSALGEPMIGASVGVIDEMGVEEMKEEEEITPPMPIGPE